MISHEELRAEVDQMAAEIGIRRHVKLRHKPDLALANTSESILSWSITYGDALLKVAEEQRRAIVAHELGHLRRAVIYAAAIAGLIGWSGTWIYNAAMGKPPAPVVEQLTFFGIWWTIQLAYEIAADQAAASLHGWSAVYSTLSELPIKRRSALMNGFWVRVALAKWLSSRPIA